jgi:hypothetical protein
VGCHKWVLTVVAAYAAGPVQIPTRTSIVSLVCYVGPARWAANQLGRNVTDATACFIFGIFDSFD